MLYLPVLLVEHQDVHKCTTTNSKLKWTNYYQMHKSMHEICFSLMCGSSLSIRYCTCNTADNSDQPLMSLLTRNRSRSKNGECAPYSKLLGSTRIISPPHSVLSWKTCSTFRSEWGQIQEFSIAGVQITSIERNWCLSRLSVISKDKKKPFSIGLQE